MDNGVRVTKQTLEEVVQEKTEDLNRYGDELGRILAGYRLDHLFDRYKDKQREIDKLKDYAWKEMNKTLITFYPSEDKQVDLLAKAIEKVLGMEEQ